MVAAGTILKSQYPKLFHMTCEAHLLHDCAMNVKSAAVNSRDISVKKINSDGNFFFFFNNLVCCKVKVTGDPCKA